ncbi:MAG: thioredoxin [Kiritimatiellaeota bacterium]|nr:thioredoxin [Kiritimatiellota bacterium]
MADKNVIEVTEANFDAEVLQSPVPVLVDLWAPWCGPCLMIAPVVEEVAEEVADKAKVCKVNVDEAPGIAARYKVRAIPNILFFKEGEVVAQQIGVTDKATLLEKLGV